MKPIDFARRAGEALARETTSFNAIARSAALPPNAPLDMRTTLGFDLEFAKQWGLAGLSIVEPSHALAASMMATTCSRDSLDGIAMPWPAFAIRVPGGLLVTTLSDGERVEFTWAAVWVDPPHKTKPAAHIVATLRTDDYFDRILMMTPPQGGLGAFAEQARLFDDDVVGETGIGWEDIGATKAGAELGSELHPIAQLFPRLIVGVAIEFAAIGGASSGSGGRGGHVRKCGGPLAWTYKMMRPIAVDCRIAIREFASGRGKSPTVQTLVRGHYKRQVCGVGRGDRRLVHIEPYWRGPEDAPIATRTHVLSAALSLGAP